MKKLLNKLCLIVSLFMCFSLIGCSSTPPEEPAGGETPTTSESENYTLTFDADNNPNTKNETKTVAKTEIDSFSDFPVLPNDSQTGFAGEWKVKDWEDDAITLIASYGNGTAENPYLVNSAEQIQKISSDYSAKIEDKFYDAEDNEVEQASATKKVEIFKTVKVEYEKSGSNWLAVDGDFTNKVHFRIIDNIDMSTVSDYSATNAISMVLDGGKYDLNGDYVGNYELTLDADIAPLFNYIHDTTFKNINLKLAKDGGTLVSATRVGTTKFENIVVNSNEEFVMIGVNNGNYSPFMNFALSVANVQYKNCVSNVNYMCSSKNMGIFLGGYGTLDTSLTFDGCVNNGDVVASTAVGMFIGNRTYKPALTVLNCKNTGDFTSKLESHIIAGNIPVGSSASTYIHVEDLDNYDTTIEGVIENTGEFSLLTSNYTASISGNDVVVENGGEPLQSGKYEFNIMGFFQNAGSTLFLTITKEIEVSEGSTSITFEKVNFLYTDKVTFLEKGNTIPQDAEWVQLEGSQFSYYLDETTGYYVFDFRDSQFKEHFVGTNSATNLNLVRTVVVRDSNGKIIDFVVDVR